MHTRSLIIVLTATSTLALAACGPTKAGLEARSEARDRINSYTAQFTYDQARQDYRSGQLDRALRGIEAALSEAPEESEYHLLRGRILLEMNLLDESIAAFNEAIAAYPEFADAYYYSGIVYQRWSDDEEALAQYSRAVELDSSNIHFLIAATEATIALGEFDAARALVKERLDYFEHDPALSHLLGQIAMLEGDPALAARHLEEALMLNADDDALLEELAWAQYDAGKYAACYESVTLLEERLDEDRADLQHLEARCLTMLDRSSEAYQLYVQLTQGSPANQSLWIELGTLSWKLGDYRRVAECSVRTIDLAPNRFEGYMLKGLYERNRGRTDAAIEQLTAAAARAEDTVLPHILLGHTLEKAGQAELALAAYRQAISVDPESQDARALHHSLASRMQVATAEE